MARTWLFQCNPSRFRVDEFLATRPRRATWSVRQHAAEIAPGDRVFIWKAIGDGAAEESGIIAEAKVLTQTTLMADHPAERNFWTDPTEATAVEPRVSLRIARIAERPPILSRTRLLDDPILADLRIFRLRNETNYATTAAQARLLSALWAEANPSTKNPHWVRDELILALDLYMRHEGRSPGQTSAEIRDLSETLNRLARYLGLTRADRFRNANGVHMKLMNFRRFDTAFSSSGRVGLPKGGKSEEDVWTEFAADAARCHAVAQTIRETLSTVSEDETAEDFAASDIEEAPEGRVITSLHRRYERNPAIVKTKKARALARFGKLMCEVCQFDFAQRYGDRGAGYIECHHTKPPSELKDGERTKIGDLELLCSNCHRMVHARRPWLTIEELRAMLRHS